MIVLDQVPKLLGVHIAKHGLLPGRCCRSRSTFPRRRSSRWRSVAATLAVLIGLDRLRPHSPAPLVAVGGEHRRLVVLRPLRRSASRPSAPFRGEFRRSRCPISRCVRQLIPGALGIALMSFTETIAAGRAFVGSRRPADRRRRELIATGAANLGGALFGSMPAGGGTSQTAVVRVGRRPHAEGVAHHGRRGGARHAALRAAARPAAERDARRGRDRLLGRTDPAGGVRRDPPGAAGWSSAGRWWRAWACWCSAR